MTSVHQCRFGVEMLESRQMLSAGPVVITEIMYHPALTPEDISAGFKENDLEFVELQNTWQSPVSLAGIAVTDGVSFTFGDLWLDPEQYVVIVNNQAAFGMRYGDDVRVAGEYQGSLKNNGEHLILSDSTGGTILDVSFDDTWYAATDGGGYSLTVVNPKADEPTWNEPTQWKPSARPAGSPGFADGTADPRPKNPNATIQSSRQVALAWGPPGDAGYAVSEYAVYRDDVVIGTTGRTAFNDTSVSPGTSYKYRIAAVDFDGREFSSTPIVVMVEGVGGDLAYAPGVLQGTVRIPGLAELSGLVASRQNLNVLWTHNDGPQDRIYAINNEGRWIGEMQLLDAPSQDVEDIAIGPGPTAGVDYLYIGDIGGNNDDRAVVQVFRVPEPAMQWNESDQQQIAKTFDMLLLQYPDGQGYNAETLLSDPHTGDLYVLTKEPKISHIYRAAASQLLNSPFVTLELVGQLGFPRASGGDISSNGKTIVIRNEDFAWLFVRGDGQSIMEALNGQPLDAPVIGRPDEPNGEGISFGGVDRGYFTISEGTNPALYYFHRTAPFFAGDANRDGAFDSSDLVQVFAAGEYEDDSSLNSMWAEGDWNGDGDFTSSDLVLAFATGLYESRPKTNAIAIPMTSAVDSLFAAEHNESTS